MPPRGRQLVVVGLDPIPEAPQPKDVHDRLEVILADARDAGVADQAIERCAQRYGQFHALYHVAGGSGRAWGDGPLHTIPLEGWQQTFELNLTTAFLSNGAAIRWFLRENQPGCILNCGSVLANSPSPNLFGTAAYATAKSALVGLTQATAAAYAPHNIRVNLLAPGLTATPMSLRANPTPSSRSSSAASNLWTAVAWLVRTISMRRSFGSSPKAAASSQVRSLPWTAAGRFLTQFHRKDSRPNRVQHPWLHEFNLRN